MWISIQHIVVSVSKVIKFDKVETKKLSMEKWKCTLIFLKERGAAFKTLLTQGNGMLLRIRNNVEWWDKNYYQSAENKLHIFQLIL